MGKVGLTFAVLLLCGSSSTLCAQARVEAGLLLDYLSVSQTNTDNFGLGGRLGYRIHRNLMMEGELAYGHSKFAYLDNPLPSLLNASRES